MFIELIDALRCPVPHDESWLVAAATRVEARHIVEGTVGCPVCKAEYPIHDGVADFRSGEAAPLAAPSAPDAELAMRVAAMLDLADSQGFAVLLGAWGSQATELSGIACHFPAVASHPYAVPAEHGNRDAENASIQQFLADA